jgi:hypothetical protein
MDDFWDDFLGLWWGKLAMGILLIGLAALMFYTFSSPEEPGGRVRWYVALAYYIGGKWTVAALFGIPGLLLTWGGINQLRTGEE